ncbi:RNA binding protein, putative [Leishmania tarentolae]|uniref:RNA binding protein, putative n=1 Tax=Leishmania tarentolae TaxID=5689 RepID=A0A640K9Z7_LEITA|nr:RNA binding protein, putative [Leishmania tarentolae]
MRFPCSRGRRRNRWRMWDSVDSAWLRRVWWWRWEGTAWGRASRFRANCSFFEEKWARIAHDLQRPRWMCALYLHILYLSPHGHRRVARSPHNHLSQDCYVMRVEATYAKAPPPPLFARACSSATAGYLLRMARCHSSPTSSLPGTHDHLHCRRWASSADATPPLPFLWPHQSPSGQLADGRRVLSWLGRRSADLCLGMNMSSLRRVSCPSLPLRRLHRSFAFVCVDSSLPPRMLSVRCIGVTAPRPSYPLPLKKNYTRSRHCAMEEFYGMEVFAGKTAKLNISADRVLHVTQVALPPNASHVITLLVKNDGNSFVLATLDPQQALFHVSVDMVFSGKQKLTFTCEGVAGAVHVIGYTQPAEDEDAFDDDDDDTMGDEDVA